MAEMEERVRTPGDPPLLPPLPDECYPPDAVDLEPPPSDPPAEED